MDVLCSAAPNGVEFCISRTMQKWRIGPILLRCEFNYYDMSICEVKPWLNLQHSMKIALIVEHKMMELGENLPWFWRPIIAQRLSINCLSISRQTNSPTKLYFWPLVLRLLRTLCVLVHKTFFQDKHANEYMRVLSATFIIGLSACRVRSTEILKDLLFHTERLEKQRLIKDFNIRKTKSTSFLLWIKCPSYCPAQMGFTRMFVGILKWYNFTCSTAVLCVTVDSSRLDFYFEMTFSDSRINIRTIP